MAIDTTRALIAQITNASQIGENTATRVGTTMDAMLDDVKQNADDIAAEKNRNDTQDSTIAGLQNTIANLNPVVIQGNVTNNPDNVFLESVNDEITPKERTTAASAKGHYIMRQTDDFAAKLKANYIHELPFDVDTSGKTFTIPSGAVLRFAGGKFTGSGNIVFSDTLLEGDVQFAASVNLSGTLANKTASQNWFANNDINAWHKFINNVSGVRELVYTSGEYSPTTRIRKSLSGGDSVSIKGNGAILHFSYDATNYVRMINLLPSDSLTWVDLSAAAAKGARTISISSASGLSVGDEICIKDTTDYSYSPYRSQYKQGEFAFIQEINGTTLTLDHALYGNYTHIGSGLCCAAKISHYRADIRDLTLILDNPSSAAGYQSGIEVEQGSGIIENVKTSEFRNGFAILHANDLSIINCIGITSKTYYANADYYGLTINNSQNVTVTGGSYVAKNHAIALGGSADDMPIVNRAILVQNTSTSVSSGSTNSSLNSHGNAEYVTFRDNTCTGIALGGSYQSAINNYCTGGSNNITFSEITSFNFNIIGNRCAAIAGLMDSMVDETAWTPPSDAKDFLLIEGNDLTYRIKIDLAVAPTSYPNSINVHASIKNNVINCLVGRPTNPGIHVLLIPSTSNGNSIGSDWETNMASGGVVDMSGNVLYTSAYDHEISAREIKLTNNKITLLTNDGLQMYSDILEVDGNTIGYTFTTTSYGAFYRKQATQGAAFHRMIIRNNYFDGIALGNMFVDTDATEVWIVEGNIFNTSTANWWILTPGATKLGLLILKNNVGGGCVAGRNIVKLIESNNVDLTNGRLSMLNDGGGSTITNRFYLPNMSGTTAQRPAINNKKFIGMCYFDVTIGKPIWCKAVNTWVLADGTTA